MKFLNQYCTQVALNQFRVSADQGSAFAKQIAGDFNPIHNADSKRFCVPGDLMFAIALNQYGLYQRMDFDFQGLVGADTLVTFPQVVEQLGDTQLQIVSDKGKPVLGVKCLGTRSHNSVQIDQLLKNYVAFSGQNFPHILVPLMQQHAVMINPQRPLVIYESMSLEFDSLDFEVLNIELQETSMAIVGKRGNAKLHFSLYSDGKVIGKGVKNLVLSGLRDYQQAAIDQLCNAYFDSKNSYNG